MSVRINQVEVKLYIPKQLYDKMTRVATLNNMSVEDLMILAINEILKKYEESPR